MTFNDWTDEDIEQLLGIDDDGNIDPETLLSALAFAADVDPLLYALLKARDVTDNGQK